MPKPAYVSFLGIAKEATPGTAVASTAYIPVKSLSPQDVVTYLADEGWRGSMVKTYGEIQGVTSGMVDFGGDVIPDTIGWPLAGILGEVATTGGSAPYTHAIDVYNTGDGQPTSYTLTDFDGVNARQFAGSKFSDLEFQFSAEGLLTYTAKAAGYASATASTPTSSFTAITPLPAWTGTVTIGGSTVSTTLDGSFAIKRPVSVLHTVANVQTPYKVFAGPVEVSGKLSFVMEADTELTRYLTNTQPSLDLDFTQGASAALVEVKLHCTKVAYTNATVDRGKDYVQVKVDYSAIANTTDVGSSGGYSPTKVTVKNAIAASTYV